MPATGVFTRSGSCSSSSPWKRPWSTSVCTPTRSPRASCSCASRRREAASSSSSSTRACPSTRWPWRSPTCAPRARGAGRRRPRHLPRAPRHGRGRLQSRRSAQHPAPGHPPHVRRRALSVLAAGLLVAAFFALWPGGREAKGAVDPKDVKLVLQWKPQAQFAGYYAGAGEGLLRRTRPQRDRAARRPGRGSDRRAAEGRADFATAFLSGALSADGPARPSSNVCQVVNRSSLMIVARRTAVKDSQRSRRRRA